jgi:hypothetical protein
MRLEARQALLACARMARATSMPKSATPAKLYACEAILEGLAQNLQDMAAVLGPFIQEAHAVVGQRHLAGHRHVTPTDQPRIREGLVGRATRAGGDQGRAVAGEAGDAMNTCAHVQGVRLNHTIFVREERRALAEDGMTR